MVFHLRWFQGIYQGSVNLLQSLVFRCDIPILMYCLNILFFLKYLLNFSLLNQGEFVLIQVMNLLGMKLWQTLRIVLLLLSNDFSQLKLSIARILNSLLAFLWSLVNRLYKKGYLVLRLILAKTGWRCKLLCKDGYFPQ